MAPPNPPNRRDSILTARRLSFLILLAIPAAATACASLVEADVLAPVPAIAVFAVCALASAAFALFTLLGTVEKASRNQIHTEEKRNRVLTDLQSQTAALQNQIAERARELESANASLRVATKVNALLALCAQHMPSGVIITDSQGMILWTNQAWETMSGLREAECTRQPIEQLLGRVWQGFEPSEGRRIIKEAQASTLETRASRPDGTVVWLTIAFQPVRNAGQQVVNYIAIIDDVTSKRESDLRLKAANDRLQLALRSSGYGIWETNMVSGHLDWDDRMLEIYGISRSSFKGTLEGWYDLIHRDDEEALRNHRQQVLDGTAQSFDIDYRIVRPNGIIRHVEAHGFLLRDPAGAPQRFVGLNRDITAEKQMQETLRVAEERLALALLATNEGVWDWNIATGQIYHDSRWAELLGEDPVAVESSYSTWAARVHPDDQADSQAALDAHMTGKVPFYPTSRQYFRFDNSVTKPSRSFGSPLNSSGTGLPMRRSNRLIPRRVSHFMDYNGKGR